MPDGSAGKSCCRWCRNTSATRTRGSAAGFSARCRRSSKKPAARVQIPGRFRQPRNHPGHRRDLRLAPDQSHRQRAHRRRSRPPLRLARDHGIPLIIDNAYGAPFPGIIFADATPYWDKHVVLTYSLSKIGLPGTRTGIVIGPPEIIRALGSMSAIVGLSNPNIGQQITLPLIESGEILRLSREVVRPFYQEKCRLAREAASRHSATTSSGSCTAARAPCSYGSGSPGLPSALKKELYHFFFASSNAACWCIVRRAAHIHAFFGRFRVSGRPDWCESPP
jgi:hypothetical protein